MTSKFSGQVFIGTSLDGFIARPDGDLKWLTERGEAIPDSGYDAFIAGVDGLIMGRTSYETVLGFDAWPYEKLRVAVVSSTLDPNTIETPETTVHRSPEDAIAVFAGEDRHSAYVDGGRLIQSFLRKGLIDRIIISYAPVLIGQGATLFGELDQDVELELVRAEPLGGGFAQVEYRVSR